MSTRTPIAVGDIICMHTKREDAAFFSTHNVESAISAVREALYEAHDDNCDSDHEGDMNECPGTTDFWLEDISPDFNTVLHFDYNKIKS